MGMLPYILLLALFIAEALAYKENVFNKTAFLCAVFIPAALLLGLRGSSVGEDTGMYLEVAQYAANVPWDQLLCGKYKIIWNPDAWGYGSSIEVPFLILCKFMMLLFMNAQSIILLCAFVTCLCFACFIYRNTDDVVQASLVFLCDTIYLFAFNGMRQTFAMAIAIQFYSCLKRGKPVLGIVWVGTGCLFHQSCALFFAYMALYYITRRMRRTWPLAAAVACIPLTVPLARLLMPYISAQYAQYLHTSFWASNIHGTAVLWAIIAAAVAFVLWRRKDSNTKEDAFLALTAESYLAIEAIGVTFTAVSRLALLPRAFMPLFYPMCLSKTPEGKARLACSVLLDALMVAQYLSWASSPARAYSLFFL